MAPRCRMRRHASSPAANAGERVRGRAARPAARVEPQPRAGDDAERALGADEQLGQVRADRGARRAAGVDLARRRRARRRGRRPCPRSSRSACSIWPAPRHASQPPTVDRSIDWGQCPSVDAVLGPQRVLEPGRRTCPGSTSSTIDSASTPTMPLIAVRSSSDTAVERARSRRTRHCGRPRRSPGRCASSHSREHRRDLRGARRPGDGRRRAPRSGLRAPTPS